MFEHTDEAENVLYESGGLGTITRKTMELNYSRSGSLAHIHRGTSLGVI